MGRQDCWGTPFVVTRQRLFDSEQGNAITDNEGVEGEAKRSYFHQLMAVGDWWAACTYIDESDPKGSDADIDHRYEK